VGRRLPGTSFTPSHIRVPGADADPNSDTGGEFSMEIDTLDFLTTSMPSFLGSQPSSSFRQQCQF